MWVWIIVGALILIYLYGEIKGPVFGCDPLQRTLFYDIDGWSVTHVLLFMILGYLYPNNLLLFFALGVLWECAEWCIGYLRVEGMLAPKHGRYWFSRTSDIIANAVGLLLGYGLAYLAGRVNNSNE